MTTIKINKSEVFAKTKDISSRKLIDWFLTENLYDDNLLCNIAHVDYTKYKTAETQQLEQLTPLFCDNIMLFTLQPVTELEKKNGKLLLKESTCGFLNTKIREILKENNIKIVGHSVKCKLTMPFLSFDKKPSKTQQNINDIMRMKPYIETYYKSKNLAHNLENAYIVTYKVELADEQIDDLLPKLQTALKTIEKLYSMYLLDFDITQDTNNIFHKKRLIEFLTESDIYSFAVADSGNTADNYIINNDNTVGSNCLTFINTTDNTRCKWYNKFVCQVTSPSVTKIIGSHLYDFLDCIDKRLNSTFTNPKTINQGVTRLEVTIYGGDLPNLKELKQKISILQDIGQEHIFYTVPICNQWKALTECITHNTIVYNDIDKSLSVAYYGNLLTKKITGCYYKLGKHKDEPDYLEKVKKYAISNYSFRCMPCHYVEIFENNDQLTFSRVTYLKEVGDTQICKTNNIFSHTDTQIDIEEKGLKSDTLKLCIPTKKQTYKAKLLYEYNEIEDNTKLYTLSEKKRQELLLQQELDNIYNKTQAELLHKKQQRKEQHIKLIEEKNKLLENAERQQNEINKLVRKFKEERAKRREDIPIKETIIITAFRVIKFAEKFNKDAYEDVILFDSVTNCTYWADAYNKKVLLNNVDNIKIASYGEGIYGSIEIGKPLITYQIKGYTWSKNGVKYMEIDMDTKKIHFYERVADENNIKIVKETTKKTQEKIAEIELKEITTKHQMKDLNKVDDLADNTKYLITEFGEITFRGKARYIIYIKDCGFYVSNYFLENEIQKKGIPKQIFYIKTEVERTTPTKHKEKYIVI